MNESIGQRVRALRGEVSQRELARRTGYSAAQVSMVESGACNPSKKFLRAVARALGHPEEQLLPAKPRARRRRKAMPRLRTLMPAIRREFGRKPHVPPPSGRMERLFPELTWSAAGLALVRELDALRRPAEFWWGVRSVGRGLTAPEQAVWLRLLLPEGLLQELHPHEIHLPHPVLCLPGRVHYAVVVPRKNAIITIHDQVTILTRIDRPPRRLDFLVTAASGGIVVPAVLEVDGPSHGASGRADKIREGEIRLPFLRVSADEVHEPGFREKVLSWAEGLLDVARARAASQGTLRVRRRKPGSGKKRIA